MASKSARSNKFRGDLQGVRGIAVLFVLLFHAGIPGFQGGFIGVDIFFVLSGFLITKNLLEEEIRTGTISIREFYAKRMRRLLPASGLVLLLTLIFGYLYLPRVLIPELTRDISAATLYISNFSFAARATDYFAVNATPSPVIHYWSLSLEEQFYIFWPVAVLLLSKLRFMARTSVRHFALLTFFASLAFAIWLLPRSEPWAFFSLPTRAWQLALGAIIATLVSNFRRLKYFVAWVLGFSGLGMVIASGLFIRSSAQFPGPIALLPTVGVGLIIIAGIQKRKTAVSALLSWRPLQYLGKISYSIYLWHWPLFVIPLIAMGHPLKLAVRVALIAITLVISAASEKFVEAKFRLGRLKANRPLRTYLAAAFSILILISSSVGVRAEVLNKVHKPHKAVIVISNLLTAVVRPTTVDAPVPEDLYPSLFDAKNDHPISYTDRCNVQVNGLASSSPCIYGDTTSTVTVALFGDSHALAWFPAINRVATNNHWKLFSQTMSACGPPDLGQWNAQAAKVLKNCPIWREAAIQKIIAAKPLFVLLTGTRGFVAVHADGTIAPVTENASLWSAGMKRTLDKFKAAGIRPIMISDIPFANNDPTICLSLHPKSSIACATPVVRAINSDWVLLERKVAMAEKVTLIEPQMWLCPSSPCPVILNNILIYLDASHMTATFSQTLSGKLGRAIAASLLKTFP